MGNTGIGFTKFGRYDMIPVVFNVWMRHNLFYVDNTSQGRGGLQGMLSEEVKKGLVGVLVLNSSKPGGR